MVSIPESELMSHAKRPDDVRFKSLSSLLKETERRKAISQRLQVNLGDASITASRGGALMLQGKSGRKAYLTNFAFGQLCERVGAPAGFLSGTDPKIAADALNHCIGNLGDFPDSSLLIRTGKKHSVVSAINSLQYTQIWDHDLLHMVGQCQEHGWKLAHDCAAYLSDHNAFAFFINPDARIDDGTDGGLQRGLMVGNSECGAGSVQLIGFLFRSACSNLQIFGMQGIEEMRLRHVGDVDARIFGRIQAELGRYGDAPAGPTEALIKRAKSTELGADRDKVITTLFNRQIAPKRTLEAAWDLGEQHVETDGSPNTVWGMFQALTRHSQGTVFGDRRVEADRDAGRILAMAA